MEKKKIQSRKHWNSVATKIVARPKKENDKIYEGVLSVTSRGTGYVSVLNFDADIEISPEKVGVAFHRDTVAIRLLGGLRGGRIQGEIIKVVKRSRIRFVGTVIAEKGEIIITPDDKKLPAKFSLKTKVSEGQKVLFELKEWNSSKEIPEASVLRVLGAKGNNDVEMEAIVLERGFNATFEPELLNEAEAIRKKSKLESEKALKNRRDFRGITTITIDPADAKDFDDALSFKELQNGNFEIGIHIADVAHYLLPKSALDAEAQKRGVSIYLVDRTIPMLPEALSNDLCSLNQNEDKLVFSAVFEMTKDGNVQARWFGRSVICSDRRMTYEEAQEVIEGKSETLSPAIKTLNEIAKKLTAKRFKEGAISFEQDEVKFELDERGRPVRVFRKTRKDAHKLVEEFMLLANKEVATFVSNLHKQKKIEPMFVYRIHDYPNEEKITELGIFLKAVGYELKTEKGQVTAKDLNALFKRIEGEAEEGIIKMAAIRSMAKATYSTKNVGHFGLGFKYYTHFTSPIRRYADVLVHRLLQKNLLGEKVSKEEFVFYEKMSAQVTESEIRATEAERDSTKLKQVEYMSERVGQIFDGVISGITEWGIYVEEKETKSEGMIKIRDLGKDYFNLDKKSYSLVGEKTKKKYSLGDSLKFKVVKADVERKTLDFALV